MAIQVVQTAQATSANDAVATFGAAVTTGNILLAFGMIDATNGQTLTLTDNSSGGPLTWNLVTSRQHAANTSPFAGIWWATAAGSLTTVTFTSSGTNATAGNVAEVSGLAASPLDTGIFSDNDDDASPYTLVSAITPSQADVILFGGCGGSGNYTGGALDANYTLIGVATTRVIGGYRIVNSIAAYNISNTSSVDRASVVALAAFKMAASGATAALTGTMVSGGVTEDEIVAGNETLIITLTGDTWLPS